jgi:hypothetical protein
METKFLHNSQNENPLHFIKGFLHVHIEKHKASFPFFVFERMQKLMSYDGVVLDVSERDKSLLKRGNDLGKYILQSVGKDFGNDFVGDVA